MTRVAGSVQHMRQQRNIFTRAALASRVSVLRVCVCVCVSREVTYDGSLNFGRCLQSPEIKQVAIKTVANRDAQAAVPEGYSQHHREKDDKPQWGQATTLFCTIRHFKVW